MMWAEFMLTVHLGEKSSWTSSLVISHSRCQICTGMTPCAGCGPGTSCAIRVLTRSWPAGPAGCDLVMGHFPHRSCEQNTYCVSRASARRCFSVHVSRLRCPHCAICSVQETQGYIYWSLLLAYFYCMQAGLCILIKHLPLRLFS